MITISKTYLTPADCQIQYNCYNVSHPCFTKCRYWKILNKHDIFNWARVFTYFQTWNGIKYLKIQPFCGIYQCMNLNLDANKALRLFRWDYILLSNGSNQSDWSNDTKYWVQDLNFKTYFRFQNHLEKKLNNFASHQTQNANRTCVLTSI